MDDKKSTIIKEIIAGAVKKNLEEMGFSDPIQADNRSKGLAFLRFYLKDIFIHFNDIDEDDLESSIVDKPNDIGIDFIFPLEDKIYIIQSKYGSSYKGISDLNYFVNLPDNLTSQEYISKAHEDLHNILIELRNIKKPTYHITFITDSRISPKDIEYYENKKTSNNVIVSILSLTELRHEYERVESMNDLPPSQVVFNLGDEDVLLPEKLAGQYPTILITQKGSKIKQIYQQHKESLFNYNIRFWLGMKNPVNKGMIDTIKDEPQLFFYYNNGVTAVCEQFDQVNNELRCKNLQIINGAQTITTIAKQSDSLRLSDLKILLKIVCAEKGKRTKIPQGLNEKIVRYNNSQTVIVPSDFHSNDSIQLSIENKSNNIQYTVESPFKKVFYKRKRRRELPKNTKVITMQDLGKSYYSFFFNPYDLNGSIRRLWDTDSNNGLYYSVFGDNGENVDTITDDKLNIMFGSQYIFEYIKKKLKGMDKESHPEVLFKYHILWGIKLLLDKKYRENDLNNILSSIVKIGKYVNDKVSKTDEEKFSTVFDRVTRHINLCIKNEKITEKIFVMRNLQRSKTFADRIMDSLETVLSSDIPELL
jgi:hypothetical protein